QDWLVFTLTVTAGSLNDTGVGALFATSLGIGYFLQGGPVQDGTVGTDTYTGDSTSVPTLPVFTFVGNGGGVGLTGTSLPLFVTYANGALPTPSIGFGVGATQFMITEFGGAGIDSPTENVTELIEIVPEPSTALLLSGGLVLLGARARRSRA
ncbi:MAG: PEP-CTERM sorting domain-containing protein, partial [Myxococcota bacterium]